MIELNSTFIHRTLIKFNEVEVLMGWLSLRNLRAGSASRFTEAHFVGDADPG